MTVRSAQRVEFLNYLLSTALEHGGYGFPEIVDYVEGGIGDHDTYALITDRYNEDKDDPEYGKVYRVDLDTMALGLKVLRERTDLNRWFKELLLADRTNGDDGDYDVISALGCLESALFGEVRYA
jgi:hypothetical protein